VDESDAATLQVIAKARLATGVVGVTLARADGARLPDWTPGAHIDLMLASGHTRQYSLCGDRWDPFSYRVAVLRELAGRGGSAFIHDDLALGHSVGLGGPRNNFHLVPSSEYIFIAGGVGITPLLSMIVQAELLGAHWALHYVGRSRSSMAFLDELAAYGDQVHVHARDEGSRLDLLALLSDPRAGVKIYSCGPSALITAVEAGAAVWPAHTLRTERFLPKDVGAPVRRAPFVVELARSGATVRVNPQTSVLEAVRSVGAAVLSSCRQGVCGTCETPVLAGEPDHRDSVLDDDERAAGDCMLICVSRSYTERLVLDL
jgi:ferredoxin-NADP reductase